MHLFDQNCTQIYVKNPNQLKALKEPHVTLTNRIAKYLDFHLPHRFEIFKQIIFWVIKPLGVNIFLEQAHTFTFSSRTNLHQES
jgi:hypothetical protein